MIFLAIFRRYIAEISCVGGYRHDISWRNIGPAIFLGEISVQRYFLEKYRSSDISWRNIGPAIFRHLSREIGDFSRYIGHLAINRRFFSDISRGQRGSTKVRPSAPSTRYSAATVPPFCLLLRGFEPQTKRFGVHPLTTWAK